MKKYLFAMLLIACSSSSNGQPPVVEQNPDTTDVDSGLEEDAGVVDASKDVNTDVFIDAAKDASVDAAPETSVPQNEPYKCRGLPSSLQFDLGDLDNYYVGGYEYPQSCGPINYAKVYLGVCTHVTVQFSTRDGNNTGSAEFYYGQELGQTYYGPGGAVKVAATPNLFPQDALNNTIRWARTNTGVPIWPDGYYQVKFRITTDTTYCDNLSGSNFVLMTTNPGYYVFVNDNLCNIYGMQNLTTTILPGFPNVSWIPNTTCP